jgi:hypothetical protein
LAEKARTVVGWPFIRAFENIVHKAKVVVNMSDPSTSAQRPPSQDWARTLNEILVNNKSLHSPEFLATVNAQNQFNRARKVLMSKNKGRIEYLQAIVDTFNALHSTPTELDTGPTASGTFNSSRAAHVCTPL